MKSFIESLNSSSNDRVMQWLNDAGEFNGTVNAIYENGGIQLLSDDNRKITVKRFFAISALRQGHRENDNELMPTPAATAILDSLGEGDKVKFVTIRTDAGYCNVVVLFKV